MTWALVLLAAQCASVSALLAGYITHQRWWPEAGFVAMSVGLVADAYFHSPPIWYAMNVLGLVGCLWRIQHRPKP